MQENKYIMQLPYSKLYYSSLIKKNIMQSEEEEACPNRTEQMEVSTPAICKFFLMESILHHASHRRLFLLNLNKYNPVPLLMY